MESSDVHYTSEGHYLKLVSIEAEFSSDIHYIFTVLNFFIIQQLPAY